MIPNKTEESGRVHPTFTSGRENILTGDAGHIFEKCPPTEMLWPLVVQETPVPGVTDHVIRCQVCRDRVESLESEINLARRISNRSNGILIGASACDESFSDAEASQTEGLPDDCQSSDTHSESNSSQSSTQPLAVIGKYFVLETICVGGQATVYRGFHPSLLIDVVIKLAHEPCQRDQAERARLVTEAKALAEVIHPHMARLYDLDFHEDRPYLVLEYVRGKCLTDYRDQKGMKPSETAFLVARVARAVACAHERGILHLDLKPDNIMVTPRGEPVLIDFGMSILTSSRATSSPQELCIAGTPQYMSPEQTRGRSRDLDTRTDVFGLGAVLYELCVGRAPFEIDAGRPDNDVIPSAEPHWHQLSRIRVPQQLKRICRKAMARDPEDRYGTATELADDLEVSSRKLDRKLRPKARVVSSLLLIVGLASLFLAFLVPAADGPLEATLNLRVIRDDAELSLNDALPLSATDCVRLQGDVSSLAQTGVFVLNDSGAPQWLGPLKLSSSPNIFQRAFRGTSGSLSLSGPSETFLFLLVVRRDEPIRRGEVRDVPPFQRSLPKIPSHTAVVFHRDQIRIVKTDDTPVEHIDVEDLQQQLQTIQQKVSGRFDDVAGVLISKDASPDEAMVCLMRALR